MQIGKIVILFLGLMFLSACSVPSNSVQSDLTSKVAESNTVSEDTEPAAAEGITDLQMIYLRSGGASIFCWNQKVYIDYTGVDEPGFLCQMNPDGSGRKVLLSYGEYSAIYYDFAGSGDDLYYIAATGLEEMPLMHISIKDGTLEELNGDLVTMESKEDYWNNSQNYTVIKDTFLEE